MKRRLLLPLSILFVLMTILTGCNNSNVKAGTYTSTAKGINDITSAVTVDSKGAITDLKVDASNETPDIGGAAAEKLTEAILANQTVKVDSIAGATYTSEAIIASVSDALTQAGIDPDNMKEKDTPKGKDEEATVDVVVVGSGTAGTGAALAASEAGAKVMILEKTGNVGGMGTTAMGLFATESNLQKEAGYKVTTKQMFEYLENYNHYRSNGPLMKAIIDKSGDTIDWLIENGFGLRMGLGVNQKAHADSPKTYHMWTNSKEDFNKAYDKMQNEYGAQLKLNTKGTKLIQDTDGKITGVIATKEDGGTLTVHASSVIVATGGFGADEEMMKENTQINEYNYFGIGNTGEGVKMAWEAGADKLGNHVLQIHLGDLTGSKTIFDRYADNAISQVKDVPILWVNKEGSRFINESIVYDNVLWGNAAYSQGGEYFTLVDQASIDKFAKEGIKLTGAYQMNGSGLAAPQGGNDINITIDPLPNIYDDIEALLKEGNILYKADSLEELAKATGMNAEKLISNVNTYNESIKTGKDNLFYKNEEYLLYPVEKGPFYAIRVSGSVYGSIGGVRINEDIQALNEQGQPIPGLFVAGADAGGMYDNTYPDVEGVTMAFAMNSGRIAGENAAALAKSK